MRWSARQARRRFAGNRVARLATADGEGRPHLVPVTFAVYGDTIATAIDHKPKRTLGLKRLANIAANPWVAVLADEYDDDWRRLWWARADGRARVVDDGVEWHTAVRHLAWRYPQYQRDPPSGPVILVAVDRWSGWAFDPSGPPGGTPVDSGSARP